MGVVPIKFQLHKFNDRQNIVTVSLGEIKKNKPANLSERTLSNVVFATTRCVATGESEVVHHRVAIKIDPRKELDYC